MMLKIQNKYTYILILLFVLMWAFFYINNKITFDKIEKVKHDKYSIQSENIKHRLQTMINDKKNSTLSLALLLAENESIKNIIINKESNSIQLNKVSLKLRKYSDFKNVWFNILDDKGTSLYRSWSKKRGDSLLKVRIDIAKMIKYPKIKSTISTGKFDMTFKSMVPIFNNDKFIGIVEIITHFNSIARKLEDSGIDSIMLVNKRYTKQLTKAFTELFIEDYYVANINAKPELMSYIKQHTVKYFLERKTYLIMDDYFISFYNLPDLDHKPMGHFLLFKKIDLIDVSEIESFKFISEVISTSLILFFLISILLIYFLFKKNQTESINKVLSKYNEELGETINIEVEKNRKKDVILQHQSRLIALGNMLENIAHQWRQPLSTITTASTGLKLQHELKQLNPERMVKSLDAITNSSQYLSSTIDVFIKFSKPDNKKVRFNISQTILDSCNIIKSNYNENKIELIILLDEEINYLGYKIELTRVFINLFNNAKDALLENNIKNKVVKILLKKCDKEECIYISILDNAGGVKENLKEKIFDPYFTTKHKSQGTGIGLYMSHEIISNHFEGELSVKNKQLTYNHKKYRGANFIIKLPLELSNAPP